MTDLASITPDKELDAIGKACPMPILMATKAFKKMEVGEILVVLTDDTGSRNDFPAWANKKGQELMGIIEGNPDKIFLKKIK